MKKLFITLVLCLMCGTVSYATENGNYEYGTEIVEFSDTVRNKSLSRFLKLDKEQTYEMFNLNKLVKEEFKNAEKFRNPERKLKFQKNIITYSIKRASEILDEEQYKKYLMVINVTLANRGIFFD